MFRRAGPVVFLALVVPACSGGAHPTKPSTPAAADTLAALAAKGAGASYSATYEFHQATPDTTATVQVWRAEPSLRVDVVAGGTTATLLRTPAGAYSCSITSGKRSCLLVARGGQPLPRPFDIAPANLFTTDLQELSGRTASYDVHAAPPLAASGPAAGARCFDVAPRSPAAPSPAPSPSPSASASGASATVAAGRYCFTADGLLAAATYPSGNTVRLTAADVSTPAAAQFTPYAKPTPLPS